MLWHVITMREILFLMVQIQKKISVSQQQCIFWTYTGKQLRRRKFYSYFIIFLGSRYINFNILQFMFLFLM